MDARRHVEHVMGTAVSFDVRSHVSATALPRAVKFLHWVDETFSPFRDNSEIARLGRKELEIENAHVEVRRVLAQCEELRNATDGWFDHRPLRENGASLDPSGFVKGWSIDRCAQMLAQEGATSLCINAGGDVFTLGKPPHRTAWRVGIRMADGSNRVAAVFETQGGAVATSGAYERGDHVWPAEGGALASVTVTGPRLAIADALATALFASGEIHPRWIRRFDRYEAIYLDTACRVHTAATVNLAGAAT